MLKQFWSIIFCLISIFSTRIYTKIGVSLKYKWTILPNEWSDCSVTCGNGTQQQRVVCMAYSLYIQHEVSNQFCSSGRDNKSSAHIQQASSSMPTVRRRLCNFGNCDQSNRYFWNVGKWSDCSTSCGNQGVRRREVECYFNDGDQSNLTLVQIGGSRGDKFCNSRYKPESMSPCNYLSCPPEFIPGKWDKCLKSRNCLPGKQRRQISCKSIQANGLISIFPTSACYLAMKQPGMKSKRPPESWRKCFDFMNTPECIRKQKLQEPVIALSKETDQIVQMRPMKKLLISIGQSAYILPRTRVIIECPVTYFVPRDLIWIHKDKKYKYKGRMKKRIKVDNKGRLRIKKFQAADEGIWRCKAGPTEVKSKLYLHEQGRGYKDWIVRTVLFDQYQRMLMDDVGQRNTNINMGPQQQWVTGPWTTCSKSCGDGGTQERQVRCEVLDSRHYVIQSDETCAKLNDKPISKRNCRLATKCPYWSFTKPIDAANQKKCSNDCISPGLALISGQLSCTFQQNVTPRRLCSHLKIDDALLCNNTECHVAWLPSNWTSCSKSCGGRGFQARYVVCVWNATGGLAGKLCYSQPGLEMPKVVRSCNTPKCVLKCVDLSKNCRSSIKLCRMPLYNYTCCKSCSNLRKKLLKT